MDAYSRLMSVGRSRTTCAPYWSPTRSAWPSSTGNRNPGKQFYIPITAYNLLPELNISVSGAQRLRISIYAPAPLPSPIEAGIDAAGDVDPAFPDVALGKPPLLP
jgi:hypothetical protein